MSLPPVIWKGNLVDLSGSDSDGEIGRSGQVIRAAVHHRMVGSLESTIREFTNASASGKARRVSSHFGIGFFGAELQIVQFVALENTAYCNGQSIADKDACRWQTWIKAGRPDANRITYSIEHEDNGAAGDYIVRAEIVEASIALDKLLFTGDGAAIRKAGIRCSDAAAKQLRAIVPTADTLVDHHVVAPISKPYCWRAIGKDPGFPQARYLAALTEEATVPGLTITDIVAAPGTVKVKNIAGVQAVQVDDPSQRFGMPPGAVKDTVAIGRLVGDPLGKDTGPSGSAGDRHTVRLVGQELAIVLAGQVDFIPDPAGGDAVQAALERAADRARAAVLDTQGVI